MPGVPNSARPAAVQPLISPARLSRGVTPLCLGLGEGPALEGPLPPRSGTVSSQKWPLNNNFYASTDKPLAERIELAHWGQSLLCKSQL